MLTQCLMLADVFLAQMNLNKHNSVVIFSLKTNNQFAARLYLA